MTDQERRFEITETDLRDFALQVQAATLITCTTLKGDPLVATAEDAEAFGQSLADFWQQFQGWMRDREVVHRRPLTDADRVQQAVHKGDLLD